MMSIFSLLGKKKRYKEGKLLEDDNVRHIIVMYVSHITRQSKTQWCLTSNDTWIIMVYMPDFPFCVLDSSRIQVLILICASGSIMLQGFIIRSDLCTRIMQNVKNTLQDQGLEKQYNINVITVIITNSSGHKVLCSL